jgi:hypothetical protein
MFQISALLFSAVVLGPVAAAVYLAIVLNQRSRRE